MKMVKNIGNIIVKLFNELYYYTQEVHNTTWTMPHCNYDLLLATKYE